MLKHKILSKYHSSFIIVHSTNTCLITLFDYRKMESEEGHDMGMVMFDFQKTFDTVDHGILLMKLKHAGQKYIAVNWFKCAVLNALSTVTVVTSGFSNAVL